METAAIVIGAPELLAVFSGSVKAGYRALLDAKTAKSDVYDCLNKLRFEELRFYDIDKTILTYLDFLRENLDTLAPENQDMCRLIVFNFASIAEAFGEIAGMKSIQRQRTSSRTRSFRGLGRKDFGKMEVSMPVETPLTAELERNILRFRNTISSLSRVKWSLVDKGALEDFYHRIRSCNDNLYMAVTPLRTRIEHACKLISVNFLCGTELKNLQQFKPRLWLDLV